MRELAEIRKDLEVPVVTLLAGSANPSGAIERLLCDVGPLVDALEKVQLEKAQEALAETIARNALLRPENQVLTGYRKVGAQAERIVHPEALLPEEPS